MVGYMVNMHEGLNISSLKTKPNKEFSSYLPVVVLVSETHESAMLIARCLQEMPKLGILNLTYLKGTAVMRWLTLSYQTQ